MLIKLNHKILEYPELEGTHQDHQIQLLALHKTIPKNHTLCLPERVVQMLLQLDSGAVTPSLGSLFQCPVTL